MSCAQHACALHPFPCRVLKAALRSPRSSKFAPPEGADKVLDMLDEKGYFAEWPAVLKVSTVDLLCATIIPVAVAGEIYIGVHSGYAESITG